MFSQNLGHIFDTLSCCSASGLNARPVSPGRAVSMPLHRNWCHFECYIFFVLLFRALFHADPGLKPLLVNRVKAGFCSPEILANHSDSICLTAVLTRSLTSRSGSAARLRTAASMPVRFSSLRRCQRRPNEERSFYLSTAHP